MRLRYDGPLVLDRPNQPEAWTVIDKTHPFYRFTNTAEKLMEMGFSAEEMAASKGDK